MPKQVDHDARRAEIAAALGRVVLRDGVASASVRTVAQEAGWSAGSLRHYFPDQAALLRFAVAQVFEQVPERVLARLAVQPSPEAARLLVEEVLPLDDVRRVELHVWFATMDRARHDPGFDGFRVQMWEALRFVCRVTVAWLRGTEAPTASDQPLPPYDEGLAAALHALIDGLAVQAFHYPERLTVPGLRSVLHGHLDVLAEAPSSS